MATADTTPLAEASRKARAMTNAELATALEHSTGNRFSESFTKFDRKAIRDEVTRRLRWQDAYEAAK